MGFELNDPRRPPNLNDARIPELGKKQHEIICLANGCGGKLFQQIELTTLFIEINIHGEGMVKGVPQPGPSVCIKCGKDYAPQELVEGTLRRVEKPSPTTPE